MSESGRVQPPLEKCDPNFKSGRVCSCGGTMRHPDAEHGEFLCSQPPRPGRVSSRVVLPHTACGAIQQGTNPVRFCPGGLYENMRVTYLGVTTVTYRCDVCLRKQDEQEVADA